MYCYDLLHAIFMKVMKIIARLQPRETRNFVDVPLKSDLCACYGITSMI